MIEYFIFKFLKILFYIIPRKISLFGGKFFGFLYFQIDGKRRKIAITNLSLAFPNKPHSFYKTIARKSFMNFGMVLFDLIKISTMKSDKLQSLFVVEGEKNIIKALSQGKGALLFTAHFGNWEIAPKIISKYGKLNVIARPLDNPLLEEELLKFREKMGSQVIYKKEASRKVLSALKRKEMIAILIDQNVLRSEGIFVDFFGKKASTTPSLAAFHLRTGSPIVPVFCFPINDYRYKVEIGSPLVFSRSKSHNKDILQITQKCTKIIEHEIKKKPSFWLWFHRRWRTRPEEEGGGDKNEHK
ncbi:lysophospholipid acyltransferase family protein [Candidatus Aminicenantes bacterium AC-708-M15]|nr:lysophospholipid acyltransferase family protein [SCandidatus Aminicenantes bacterium Aminicenantia_JdfR_composite]MCP2604425.1 lysophospholipid acyltransferase family protein [Candidatus Aminicenantes bacterium AC-708-M15]MCP2606287.1 lysophospholipid acyltransferase family protein [Candidatus Aminicenantes bacterium AC-708-I09]MCP2619209.1 lysophospholipid acyltransferase family protein [Candidatus Aminicenantes bacterium AC-335-K20]MCP2620868.1 lysophospholipid acyltransferase family prote